MRFQAGQTIKQSVFREHVPIARVHCCKWIRLQQIVAMRVPQVEPSMFECLSEFTNYKIQFNNCFNLK